MDAAQFRIYAKEAVDYITDYLETLGDRKVSAITSPGFLQSVLPFNAPEEGEDWNEILSDINNLILPGCLHWQSPHMHAYYPALNSYPSMLGEMIANAISPLAFTYASCPAATELEMSVMNWLARMIGLPEHFMHGKNGVGGGVILTTASEGTLVSLLAARNRAIETYKPDFPNATDAEILGKFVAYTSDQAHSSIEKGARIAFVTLRHLESDENLSLRGQTLRDEIQKDKEQGLIPIWVAATLGTTSSCAFDNLEEIGRVCEEEGVWLHVDAAYAGTSFICPEFRSWLKGIDMVDSIVFNPSKWMLVHFDCTALWVRDYRTLHRAFIENPTYLNNEFTGVAVDFMNWQIPLSRRFRALKMWCVIRSYGVTGLQQHVRHGVHLAEVFESLVRQDPSFEIGFKRHLALVVFSLKAGRHATELLWERVNKRGKIHCVATVIKNKYVIRFCVTSPRTTVDDILKDWKEIQTVASELQGNKASLKLKTVVPGKSLLLSHTPKSPKIIDGSFIAMHDKHEDLHKWFQKVKLIDDDHEGAEDGRPETR